MDGSAPDPAERALDADSLATARFVPGEDELLTTVVDLIEAERGVDLAREAPLGESVDWDALDELLDDEERAMNVASVTFAYHDVIVRITGSGVVTLYDDPAASSPASDSGDDPGDA